MCGATYGLTIYIVSLYGTGGDVGLSCTVLAFTVEEWSEHLKFVPSMHPMVAPLQQRNDSIYCIYNIRSISMYNWFTDEYQASISNSCDALLTFTMRV